MVGTVMCPDVPVMIRTILSKEMYDHTFHEDTTPAVQVAFQSATRFCT